MIKKIFSHCLNDFKNAKLNTAERLVRKKTRGFPNRGERYGVKYENGVAYLLSYTVSVEKLWIQNTRIIHDVSAMKNPDALRIFFP
jgi:hypothetical protein